MNPIDINIALFHTATETKVSPDIPAVMRVQALLPALGPNHLAVTDKLYDLLSEGITCLLQANLEL